MTREIRIYVEGGGDGKDTKAQIRRGFDLFLWGLKSKARARNIRWSIVACGPRNKAFYSHQTACRTHPDAFNVLLVDSEGPVGAEPWAHLRQRDGWRCDLPDDNCHLMVQAVEAWIIADKAALRDFYGPALREAAIPDTQDVERIDKERLLPAMIDATRNTQKGRYHKIRHAAKLLGLLGRAVEKLTADDAAGDPQAAALLAEARKLAEAPRSLIPEASAYYRRGVDIARLRGLRDKLGGLLERLKRAGYLP